jgi:hypothetical protein
MKIKKINWAAVFVLANFVYTSAGTSIQSPISEIQEDRHEAEWSMLIFIEGRNNLNTYAKKNIQDMMSVGSSDRVNVLVQWYQPDQKTWRYKIEKSRIVPHGFVERKLPIDCGRDLVDFMEWGVKNFPAKHYCLILWDHGLGIMDPRWKTGQTGLEFAGRQSNSFACASSDNPRTQIPGITTDIHTHQFKSCQRGHRGILFNDIDRTYMTNQDMVQAFSKIKTEILGGKNIDVVGMDACFMSMLEVLYQVRNYADFLVGSEEVELAQGWSYGPLLAGLLSFSLTPEQLAESIVLTFEHYYKPRTELYTQSAIDLKNVEVVRENLDDIIACLRDCIRSNEQLTWYLINRARRRCQQFTTPAFIDLHSFYTELHRQFQAQGGEAFTENSESIRNGFTEQKDTFVSQESFLIEKLKQLLCDGMRIIEGVVIANATGQYLRRSKGISIYCPCHQIDESYHKTEFVNESLWFNFVDDMIKHK